MRFPFAPEFLKYCSPILYTFDYRNVLLTYQLFFESKLLSDQNQENEPKRTYRVFLLRSSYRFNNETGGKFVIRIFGNRCNIIWKSGWFDWPGSVEFSVSAVSRKGHKPTRSCLAVWYRSHPILEGQKWDTSLLIAHQIVQLGTNLDNCVVSHGSNVWLLQ